MKRLLFTILIALAVSCSRLPNQPAISVAPLYGKINEGIVETKPQWDGQLGPNDLKPGEFAFKVGQRYIAEILILTEVYWDEEGKCRFDSADWDNDKPRTWFKQKNYCTDYGLAEYTDQRGWNKYGHLIPSDRKPLMEAELNALMATLQLEPFSEPLPEPEIDLGPLYHL